MKRLIIFDLDGTLFDTYAFYADVLVHLNRQYGLNREDFELKMPSYYLLKHGAYDFYRQLQDHLIDSWEQASSSLARELPRVSYLYDDAKQAIKRLRSEAEIVILTVGTSNWQQTKLDYSPEIKDLQHFIIMQGKGEHLSSLISSTADGKIILPSFGSEVFDRVDLVDDAITNFEGLEQRPKGFHLTRIRRGGAKHDTIPTPVGINDISRLDGLI